MLLNGFWTLVGLVGILRAGNIFRELCGRRSLLANAAGLQYQRITCVKGLIFRFGGAIFQKMSSAL
jgi:hypothetical protein